MSQESYPHPLHTQTTSTSSTENALVVDKPLCPAGGASCPGEAGRNVSCSACETGYRRVCSKAAADARNQHRRRMVLIHRLYVCVRACARASERASEHEGARLRFSSALFLIQFFHRHVTRSNKCLSLYRTRALSHTHAHMHAQILDPTRQAAVARTTTTRTQWKRRGICGKPLCQQWHQLHRPLSTR